MENKKAKLTNESKASSSGSEILYQSAAGFSVLGNAICAVVLPLIILQETGSPSAAGMIALAVGVPQFLAALFGGVLVDRHSCKGVAIMGDVLSAVSMFILAGVCLLARPSMVWFIICGVISALGDVPALTARKVMVSYLAKNSEDAMKRIVATREAISTAAILAGPILAAWFLLVLPQFALLITALTSLTAALFTLALPKMSPDPSQLDASAMNHPIKDFLEGGRYLFQRKQLTVVVLLGLFVATFVACVQGIVLPCYFTQTQNQLFAGFSLSALALGSMIGAGLYVALAKILADKNVLLTGIVIIVAGAWLLSFLINDFAIVGSVVVLGLGIGICSSFSGVKVLELTELSYQGRVLGNENALILGLSPLLSTVTALLIEGIGIQTTLFIAVTFLTVILAFLGIGWKKTPDTDGTAAPKPDPEL